MKVAVYCSAKNQIPEDYLCLGDTIGKWLAVNGHSLVYGGATGGLMTRVSEAFKQAKDPALTEQKLIGVVPEQIIRNGRKSDLCDELHVVAYMSERKQRMRELADCFVCLPGSYGTLDEMMDVIASGTVNEHHKPCIILNHNGFYNPLLQLIDCMKQLRFIPEQESYRPLFVGTTEELYQTINTLIK